MGAEFSVIAGKRWKSYLVYKVNGHAKLVWRQIQQIGVAVVCVYYSYPR